MNILKRNFNKKSFVLRLILSAAITFMLCVFEPLNLYFANKSQYQFDFYRLFPICFAMFLLFFLIFAFFSFMIGFAGKNIQCFTSAVMFILFIGLYIEGNLHSAALPPLDGRTIIWEEYNTQQIQSLLIWGGISIAVVLLIGFIKLEKFEGLARNIAIFIALVLAVTAFGIGFSRNGFEHRSIHAITKEGLWRYSKDTNFIILVLDAIDETEEYSVLERHPEYMAAYSDFVYYDNVLSGYAYTRYALPLILTGEWYELDEDYEDYCEEAYGNSAMLKALSDSGFSMGGYSEALPMHTDEMYMFENVKYDPCEIESYSRFCKGILKLVAYKYMPYFLKSRIIIYENELNELILEGDTPKVRFNRSNERFFESCNTEMIELSDKKCFKLIHIEGGHLPFIYRADVSVDKQTSYKECVEAANTITCRYLEKLKENGVYDNSVIIIMSDHGLNRNDAENPHGRQHPILMIKGIGEKRDAMEINSNPISQDFYSEKFTGLIEKIPADEVFSGESSMIRQRRHLYSADDFDSLFVEYICPENLTASEKLTATGQEYK